MPKNAGPPAVEEEKKHNQRNVMVLNAALESSEAHAPMHFYNAQRRQYLENRNKAAQKRSEENDKFNSSLSKDLRGKFQRKKGVVHPISIRIDRFGRIAFNKNKELSQASYENCERKASPGGPKSSSSDREERKNALPAPN